MTPGEATRQLFQAAQSGNVSNAKKALDTGAELDATDNRQQTPLHWAAGLGHAELAGLLIDKGANPNARNNLHETPLHWTAGNGHIDTARLLIDNGADVNAGDNLHWTPLHVAASEGHTQLARLLIDRGAEVSATNDRQQTPLHRAAGNGHTELARRLIEKGAKVNARDDEQRTPLHWAARNGHTELADLLRTAQRWHTYVKPLLGADQKLDVTQLVDPAGQPTEALKNLLPNDLFAHLARPDFYRQGMDGLVQVFPCLPEAVQASIDLVPWRRSKVLEANAAAGPETSAVERYVRRPRHAPAPEVSR